MPSLIRKSGNQVVFGPMVVSTDGYNHLFNDGGIKILSSADKKGDSAQASHHSWKDKAWTICFIIILVMCFIPSLQDEVGRGFAILSQTPDWFQWALLASIGASFGLRGFSAFAQKAKKI